MSALPFPSDTLIHMLDVGDLSKSDLARLCLVCRELLALVRPILYRDIKLFVLPPPASDDPSKVQEVDVERETFELPLPASTLDDASNQLVHVVQTHPNLSSYTHRLELDLLATEPEAGLVLEAVLPHLPNLRQLRLEGVTVDEFENLSLPLLQHLANLQHDDRPLQSFHVRPKTPNGQPWDADLGALVLEMLPALSHLTELSLGGGPWPSNSDKTVLVPPTFHLRRLSLTDVSQPWLDYWTTSSLSSLTHLTISDRSGIFALNFGKLSSLQHLSVSFHGGVGGFAFHQMKMELATCSSLTSFSFATPAMLNVGAWTSGIRNVVQALPETLVVLDLQLPTATRVVWDALAGVVAMQTGRLTRFRKLLVRGVGSEDHDRLREACGKRGVALEIYSLNV
ncbi:hypothetical protein MNV49_006361 [Pseudohyphozyma bogoriensis]|nr:hypothetical protein MNV49_006361 [Pseudohyphozyma bogoriensis]